MIYENKDTNNTRPPPAATPLLTRHGHIHMEDARKAILSDRQIVQFMERDLPGRVAGKHVDGEYEKIMVLGIRYPSHRLAFFYVHGFMPEIVDHINGDIKDNRIMNLRAATASQNGHNKFIASNNRSGFKGVSWSNQQRKWEAYITVNYKRTRLGFFRNKDDAAKAVMSAREKMVGEFANHQ